MVDVELPLQNEGIKGTGVGEGQYSFSTSKISIEPELALAQEINFDVALPMRMTSFCCYCLGYSWK